MSGEQQDGWYQELKEWVKSSFNSVAGQYVEAIAKAGHDILRDVGPGKQGSEALKGRQYTLDDGIDGPQ